MANNAKYTKILAELLQPKGFYKHGRNFLRLHGDVLQGVDFYPEPHAKYMPEAGDGNVLSISLHSVYSNDVFVEFAKSYKGSLTDPKLVGELYGFDPNKEPIQRKNCRKFQTEWEQLDLFKNDIMNTLDTINTQSALCQLLQWSDITVYGEPLLVNTSLIAPLAYLGRYDEATQYCDGIIRQHSEGQELTEASLTPEQIERRRNRSKKVLQPYIQLKTLMAAGDHASIMDVLQANRTKNIEMIHEVFPKSRATQF